MRDCIQVRLNAWRGEEHASIRHVRRNQSFDLVGRVVDWHVIPSVAQLLEDQKVDCLGDELGRSIDESELRSTRMLRTETDRRHPTVGWRARGWHAVER